MFFLNLKLYYILDIFEIYPFPLFLFNQSPIVLDMCTQRTSLHIFHWLCVNWLMLCGWSTSNKAQSLDVFLNISLFTITSQKKTCSSSKVWRCVYVEVKYVLENRARAFSSSMDKTRIKNSTDPLLQNWNSQRSYTLFFIS